jgi:hypothetical protein
MQIIIVWIYIPFFEGCEGIIEDVILLGCQLKLNWHLNLLEMYIELIYTWGLIDVFAT